LTKKTPPPVEETPSEEAVKVPDLLAVLPLKDSVVLPYIIVPLSVGRDKSVAAVDHALSDQRVVLLLTQKDAAEEDPREEGLYRVGTAATIMRMLKLPDGRTRILVQGVARVAVDHVSQTEPFFLAKVRRLNEPTAPPPDLEIEALLRSVKEGLERVVALGRAVSSEVQTVAANLTEAGRLADLVAANIELKIEELQALLETLDPVERLRRVSDALQREIQVLTMQQEISSQARGEMDKSQREYYLRQQLRAIQLELGEGEEMAEEIATYRTQIEEKGIPEEAKLEIEKQIRRLERSHPDSAETGVLRTYLDWLTGLPWSKLSEDDLELKRARQILDEDHFDLEKVKERIVEYLAVRKLKSDTKGPILCFVGPPGVGKTSLGRSIARAMGRKFVRISLGGVRDEAEIRGHRRTYVGALPGRIVQGIHQAGTSNPVFMLDEIDKLGADYRGDPSSALLEVLDPEQNSTFRDHYLGVSYDLSRVLFIATANLLEPIQPAFLDRMEVLRLSGYTEEEKVQIARRHVIPKQLAENGLSPEQLDIGNAALRLLIGRYTREAGLRNLEREIAAVCRKIAVKVARGENRRHVVGAARIGKLLGPERHLPEELLRHDRVGIATGLAWTAAGGDILLIEVLAVPGKGSLQLTGQLGEVMKESAQAALSYSRAFAAENGHAADAFTSQDLHVHVPAGSIPKDGPSAGITIATAMVSVLTKRAVRRDLAMTGEITLRGDVLPIGGVKEKVLAARAAGVTTVLLPKLNQRDLVEVSAALRRGLEFHFVAHMDEVLQHALVPLEPAPPVARPTAPSPSRTPARPTRPAKAAPRAKPPGRGGRPSRPGARPGARTRP
jgi:ATP-dependent Lon protease